MQVGVPISLTVRYHFAQHQIQGAVKPFYCPVGTRFIWGSAHFVNLEYPAQIAEQCGFETGSLICEYLFRTAVPRNPLVQEHARYRHSLLVSNWVRLCPARKMVDHSHNIAVSSTGYWMRPRNVYSKALHRLTHHKVLWRALPRCFATNVSGIRIIIGFKKLNFLKHTLHTFTELNVMVRWIQDN